MSLMDVNMGKMHGSIWWTLAVAMLMDLICPRSAGVMAPVSLPSFFRTSASSAASPPKSMLAGCGLQSAAFFFVHVGAVALGAAEGRAGGGMGAVAEEAASARYLSYLFSSQASAVEASRHAAAKLVVFIAAGACQTSKALLAQCFRDT